MASIEVAQVTSIVANAMAASVEVEPNYGLNYVDLMHQMGINPPQNGLALGKLVKSGYIQYSKDKKKLNTKKTYFDIDQIAYSVFDLTTLSAFNDKLTHFASQFQTVLEEGSYVNYESMSQGLIRATGYPFKWVEGKYRGNELETDNLFIDLTNFLQNVAERLPNVQAPANDVLTALDQVVIDYESNLGTINPHLATINPNAGRVSIDIGQNDAYLSNLSNFDAYKSIHQGIAAYKRRKENDVWNPEGNLVPANCPPGVVCADVPNWLELSAEENVEQKVYGVDAYFGQIFGNISNIYLIKRGIYRIQKVTEDLKIPLSGNEACSYQLCVTDDHCENITLTAQGHLLLADADVNESSAVVSFCQDETNDQWLACSVVTQNENVWGRAEELYPGDSITPSTLHVQNGQKEIRTGNTLFVESEPVVLKQQCSLPEATIVAVYYGANGQPQFQQLCVGKHCENAGVIIHT